MSEQSSAVTEARKILMTSKDPVMREQAEEVIRLYKHMNQKGVPADVDPRQMSLDLEGGAIGNAAARGLSSPQARRIGADLQMGAFKSRPENMALTESFGKQRQLPGMNVTWDDMVELMYERGGK